MTAKTRDVLAGSLIFLLGIFIVIYATRHYELGTLLKMGPGFFPTLLGSILTLLGIMVIVPASFAKATASGIHPERRGLCAVLAAMCAFALLVEPFGLVAASAATVAVGSGIGSRLPLNKSVVLVICLTALAVGIFKFGLQVRAPLFHLPF